MKQAKGWEEEEDDYALFASPSNKKGPKKAFKGCCRYCGEFGHKAIGESIYSRSNFDRFSGNKEFL